MSTLSRREFLAGAAAAGATALAGLRTFAAPIAPKVVKGTDLVTLGKSKIKTTVLGIGTGTHGGREQRDLGEEGFVKLARHAYDRGIRYIDTADAYKMHPFVRAALKELPREEIFVQTKTRAKDAQTAKDDLERLRRELDTEYLDSLLMHAMGKRTWPTDMRPVMDVLYEAKQKGIVRAVGISCHGFEPLAASVEPDWLDVNLVRINPFDSHMDGPHDEVAAQIKKMHQEGRGIIGMKVYGEGDFENDQQRLQSLKYVLGLGSVHAFTIGFVSPEQIDETLDLIEQATA
ncbi:MAG TPA: aldo/keto reductase [Thermoguttaceae bacterium]|nr:aldo/keto reductase [Thermoguttaceae bacterium]